MAATDYILPIVGTVLGWIGGNKTGKRKAKAEADSLEVQNAKAVIMLWKENNAELRVEMRQLKDELLEVRKENHDLVNRLHEVSKENAQLRKDMNELKKTLDHNNNKINP